MSGFEKADQSDSNNLPGSFEKKDESHDQRPFLAIGDRVFSTPADVEKFYRNANDHIKSLEEENKTFKETQEQLRKAADDNLSARELLQGIKDASTSGKPSETPSVNKDELVAEIVRIATTQVSDELKSHQQKEYEDKNLSTAMNAAKEAFGETFIDDVLRLGVEHGLDSAAVNNLAKTSPVAFEKLFLPAQKGVTAPVEGSINTSSLHTKHSPEKRSIMKMSKVTDRAAEMTRRILEKESQQSK